MARKPSRKIKKARIQKRKPIYKTKSFWVFILGFVIGAGLVYFLIYSDTFQITKIEISGNQKVSNENLKNAIEPFLHKKIIKETKSLFLVSIKDAEKKITEEFPQIEVANLRRQFPGTLVLEAKERRGILTLCCLDETSEQTDCFSVDQQGIIFEKSTENQGLIVYSAIKDKIILGKEVITKKGVSSILEIYKTFQEDKNIKADKFFLFEDKFSVLSAEGFEIYFDLEDNIAEQITNLDLILKEEVPPEKRGELEYIDLRFGNKIYYKSRE